VVKGEIYPQKLTAMSGVSNIGTDRNWTDHLFGQANWYVFGRMAWDTDLSARDIAEEWTRMTFTNEDQKVDQITDMMMNSHEACVNYMTPLGLHHIMGPGHHYGPGPWVKDMSRADWTSVYYHKADERGIGFDRTTTGSSATSQYSPEIAAIFENRELCPEKYLLWFHHVGWDEKLKNGKTLWQSIAYKYDEGVHEVEHMKATWSLLKNDIDTERFQQVDMMLTIQLHDARWWRNACLLYFQQFAKRPFPADIEQPRGDLEEYEKMTFPYAPGIKPRW
jgi:alpha-glucuronidase